MKNRSIIIFLIILLAAVGVGYYLYLNRPQPTLHARYLAAVADAAVAETSELDGGLVPLSEDNPDLIWNAERTKLLVASWKSQKSYDTFVKPNTRTPAREDQLLWVTAAPQLKRFCQAYLGAHPNAAPEDVSLRLKQYLGLDSEWSYDVFVEMWVSPRDLFRPCGNPDPASAECPLTLDPATTPAVAGIADYRAFFQALYFRSIRSGMQPWTGLGYTYDWGNPESDIGASEFILNPGAAYEIKQATPTMDYCRSALR